jgi:hypothetical protein
MGFSTRMGYGGVIARMMKDAMEANIKAGSKISDIRVIAELDRILTCS